MSLKSLKKLRRQKLKKDMNGVHSSDTPQQTAENDDNTVAGASHIENKDLSCRYVASCTFQNCLGCRKLK